MEMIKVDNVSMRFVMANDRISSIKEFVTAFLSRKLKFKEFWALKNVSFTVNKGEVVGIIGRNGAGKSTLLKIISGILTPTKGKVSHVGNIVPMLELGSGFDPDLSGRENIFLNGAILGYSKEFLESKYEEILEFSELGDFINIPIRNYSSGMMMRLAFSVATVVNPEILIVDEILAVGDENFQKKSKDRMLELMSGGTTVLFVSHSLDQIREMCDRVVWLDNHTVKMVGPTQEVCDAYNISDPVARAAQAAAAAAAPTEEPVPEEDRYNPKESAKLRMMQYDHHQRYDSIRYLVHQIKKYANSYKPYKVMETAADGHKLLEKVLLDDIVTYSNKMLPEDRTPNQYDILVMLNSLANLNEAKRNAALKEALRLAPISIIGFPIQSDENIAMEKAASAYYENIFGMEYIWFKHHFINGLPDMEGVKKFLAEEGYYFASFTFAGTSLVRQILEAQFSYEYYQTGLLEEMEDITGYYEKEIFPHDIEEKNYRCFFVVTKDQALAEHIQKEVDTYFARTPETDAKYRILEDKIKALKEKAAEFDKTYR